ncbi:MAG TPA: hypothetical protein VJU13_03605 [Candidatus Nitrosocosmicus sp.]|nr:hypothetical protein [Candidatus Nitrosocosmicus sp.]
MVTTVDLDEAVCIIDVFTFDGRLKDIVEIYTSTDNKWVQKISSLPLQLMEIHIPD